MVLFIALFIAVSVAPAALAEDQNVDLGGQDLGDPDEASSIPSGLDEFEPTLQDQDQSKTVETADGAPTLSSDALEGYTSKQLNDLQDKLKKSWLRAQTRVQYLEIKREALADQLDSKLQGYEHLLISSYDNYDSATFDALRSIRSEGDLSVRASLVAKLTSTDQRFIKQYFAASDAVDKASEEVDNARAKVISVGSDLEIVRAVISGPVSDGQPKEEAIQASNVFATGPIPDIGYWGSVSDQGMLGGWSSLASAALGGIGCNSPSPGLVGSGVTETGEASWYGPGFHGNNTANGEVYDQNGMTAAHKSLPFGTVVRVYSQTTARCVFVRINDRGPYIDGRIIDLSHTAAQALGMDGTAPVIIEVWARPGTPVLPIVEPPASEWPKVDVAAPSTDTENVVNTATP